MDNHGEDLEWDMFDDFGLKPSGSEHRGLSLVVQKHARYPSVDYNRAVTLASFPETPYISHSLHPYSTFRQNEMASSDNVKTYQELDLDAKRVLDMGFLMAGVPINSKHQDSLLEHDKRLRTTASSQSPEIRDLERDNERFRKLGFVTRRIHIDRDHESWHELRAEEKEASEAASSTSQPNAVEQVGLMMIVEGVMEKWCWVITGDGTKQAMPVIEDSGSTNNWISGRQMEHFGLRSTRGAPITGQTLTGEVFSSDKYVDVSWEGKGLQSGTDRFYVAPPRSPIQMLVGYGFTERYPGVFMDQEPPSKPQLLTLQTRKQVDEQQQINTARRLMEEGARELEKKRRGQMLPGAPAHTSTTSSWGQATLASSASRKRFSK